jgi:phosphoribosyl-AMP cyclohydrolase
MIMAIAPDFDKAGGLVPVIVQQHDTKEVLMLAYMNAEAWETTLTSGLATYYSRSRKSLWVKGQTSGHVQQVRQIRIDCDRDTVLLLVDQVGGAACHTGYRSCFYRIIENRSERIDGQPVFDPLTVYGK